MQKCIKCNHKLRYKNKLWSLLFSDSPIACEWCGSEYHVRFSARIINGSLIVVPVILLNHLPGVLEIAKRFNIDVFVCYLIWIVLVIALMPLWTKFYFKD